MNPKPLTAIALRCSLATALVLCVFAPAAPARSSRASSGVVHKSAAYWSDYKSDIIRQVFDGAFGKNMDGDLRFHALYAGYVEQFSDSCRAYLPSRYLKRTITRTVDGITSTTEIYIDLRFLPKYDDDSPDEDSSIIKNFYGVFTGRVSLKPFLDPRLDIFRFFSKESCKSAAMRQFGENLLRAANGKPSLQAVGASIAGAAAESDASAPARRSESDTSAPAPSPTLFSATAATPFFATPRPPGSPRRTPSASASVSALDMRA